MRAYCRLFKSSKIIPEKNFAVANIFEYLGSLDYLKFNNINYFKFDKLKPTLKLQLSQDLIEMMNSNDYNYCFIQNDYSPIPPQNPTTRPYLYFINNKTWKSENCIELELMLDTINTFAFNVDYKESKKNKV